MATRNNARRAALVLFAGVVTVSCVDLFHSTAFATLCDDSPTDPKCVDGAVANDASAVDSGIPTLHPHPDFCSWSHSTVYANATKVCARLGGCVGPIGVKTGLTGGTEFGACVIAAQLAFDCTVNPALRPGGDTDKFWSCVSTATSCDEIRTCVYPNAIDVCGNDGGTGLFTACSNEQANVQLQCSVSKYGPPLAATPCVMNGQACATADMSTAECTGSQGYNCVTTTCTDETHASDCVGAVNPIDYGVDCASMSATCAVQDGGAPGCKPNVSDPLLAPPCGDGGDSTDPTCGANNVAQACIDHKLVTIDCAHLGNPEGTTPGLPCDVTTPPPLYAIANACNDLAVPCVSKNEGCAGGTLTACARGREVKVDCTAAGFDRCAVTADGLPYCMSDKPNPIF